MSPITSTSPVCDLVLASAGFNFHPLISQSADLLSEMSDAVSSTAVKGGLPVDVDSPDKEEQEGILIDFTTKRRFSLHS